MRVYVYRNKSRDDDYVKSNSAIMNTLESMLDTLLNYGAINSYTLNKYDDYAGISEPPDPVDWSYNVEDWRMNDPDVKDRRGSHLVVSEEYSFANAASGADRSNGCNDPTAFVASRQAWVGTDTSKERYMNGARQETLHNFIAFNNPTVKSLCDGGNYYNEHRLGTIHDNAVTPMLTYHENESNLVEEGQCVGDGSAFYRFDQSMTSCTKQAVDATHNTIC